MMLNAVFVDFSFLSHVSTAFSFEAACMQEAQALDEGNLAEEGAHDRPWH